MTENIDNKTFIDLQNYVNGLVNNSKVLSMESLLTYQNLTNGKLDALQVDIEKVQDEFTKILSVFDEWAMTEDEGKLLLGLKEKVDILRFSVTRKLVITSNVYFDSMRMHRLFFNRPLHFIPFSQHLRHAINIKRGAL